MDLTAIDAAFRATEQMRRQRYTLASPGFDPDEVLAAIAQWARLVEDALTAAVLELDAGDEAP